MYFHLSEKHTVKLYENNILYWIFTFIVNESKIFLSYQV